MKNRFIAELAILFGIMFLPGYFAQTAASSGPGLESLSYHIQYALLAIPQIALILYFMTGRGSLWKVRYGFSTFSVHDALRGTIVFFLLLLTAIPVLMIITRIAGTTENQVWQPESPALLIPAALTLTLGAAREEAFFRSFLLAEVEDIGVKTSHAVIGSALLFGLGHAYQGFAGLLTTMVMGGVLGTIYARRRNIYEVTIGHALYNFSVLVYWVVAGK